MPLDGLDFLVTYYCYNLYCNINVSDRSPDSLVHGVYSDVDGAKSVSQRIVDFGYMTESRSPLHTNIILKVMYSFVCWSLELYKCTHGLLCVYVCMYVRMYVTIRVNHFRPSR
jgi:hypothetical protein